MTGLGENTDSYHHFFIKHLQIRKVFFCKYADYAGLKFSFLIPISLQLNNASLRNFNFDIDPLEFIYLYYQTLKLQVMQRY